MKFSRNLSKNQVPLWADFYLDYHGLKNSIKGSRAESGETLPQAVLDQLHREIDNVEIFYYKIYTRDEVSKFNLSHNFLQQDSWHGVHPHELRYFLAGFIHRRSELKKIQWYGQINACGFRRLLEKLAHYRFSGVTSTKLEDLESKLDSAQFSSQTDLLGDLELLQSTITSINVTLSKASCGSTHSLILDRFSSRSFPPLKLDLAYEAIKRDDVSYLDQFMQDNVATVESGPVHTLIFVFIQFSIAYGSVGCIARLLLLLKFNREEDSVVKDYLRLFIIGILDNQAINDSTTLFSRVLSKLDRNVQATLLARDLISDGLQYAVQHGLLEACELLLGHMQGSKDDFISSRNSITLQDHLGSSPLRVAITRGDDKISKLLLEFYCQERPSENETGNALSGALLADAIKSDPGILNELMLAGANVDHQSPHGETALYIAARSGNEDSVKILLSHKANVTIAEKARGWTPLIVASVEGHVRIVQLLVHAGAAQEYKDLLGWTAIDHAAFRGHITLAKELQQNQAESRTTSVDVPREGAAMSRIVESIRMPLHECLLLVNLGSFDSCKYPGATDNSADLAVDDSAEESKVGISIQFFLIGQPDSGPFVDLPILEETINKPRAFYTKDPDNAKVMFKIYRKATSSPNRVEYVHVGSGIALLNNLKPGLGCDRESLVRDYKIPILAKNSLEDVGTVTFSFLLVKPHSQSTSFTSASNFPWGNGGVTKVVGHRGMYSMLI